MPKWTVAGADKESGRDLVSTIEAPTEARARQQAAGKGILISTIERSVADPFETIATVAEQLQRIGAPTKTTTTPAEVGYSTAVPANGMPEYGKIVGAAKVLEVFGVLFLSVGALLLTAGLAGWIYIIVKMARGEPLEAGLQPLVMVAVGSAVASIILGVLLRMAGAIGMAVRDLARNSFRA